MHKVSIEPYPKNEFLALMPNWTQHAKRGAKKIEGRLWAGCEWRITEAKGLSHGARGRMNISHENPISWNSLAQAQQVATIFLSIFSLLNEDCKKKKLNDVGRKTNKQYLMSDYRNWFSTPFPEMQLRVIEKRDIFTVLMSEKTIFMGSPTNILGWSMFTWKN